ncbi:type IV secretory system conjugative DNA transfer family protein [Conexibacter sp. DBS9H8]|uniref:type IV secretory system conjugative DNA transfer family protein n=1 Tax=Conexibacter sp. DBS9H8 TaxID=2937801 RepID=UPI00200D54C9|nr:type IV secretory system conjugative DNA transfer family protein [Conexibacter sp. DBS9H8]
MVAKGETYNPLDPLRQAAARAGGVFLGLTSDRQPRFSRDERAVLLLGPPRSGKSSAVIIPAILSHTGPVVSTSTKPDVYTATRLARVMEGDVWTFDPTGHAGSSAHELRWSPVQSARSWDGAQLMARALCANIGAGTQDRSHWALRAQALLAPMLHAAAVHERDMGEVVGWVLAHDLDAPGVLLEDERCSQLAFSTLVGVLQTEARERSSIFSSAADALSAYGSEHALAAARDVNFDPDVFVTSNQTVYITAPADAQAGAAPIVCGLLSAIRRATYRAHASGRLRRRVLFALDEVANIAPLDELPQIASEGGGQGLLLMAALQDLSQARHRWGVQADGFLTLFGTKLLLPGIADTKTLETVSAMLGEYDREVTSYSDGYSKGRTDPVFSRGTRQRSMSVSAQRTRVMAPGEVAQIPAGRALHLDGVAREFIDLAPAHTAEPFRTITQVLGYTAP